MVHRAMFYAVQLDAECTHITSTYLIWMKGLSSREPPLLTVQDQVPDSQSVLQLFDCFLCVNAVFFLSENDSLLY